MNDTRAIRDIEDNYPQYVSETLGYTYDVWDVVPTSIRAEHDRIFHLNSADLAEHITASLPDVARWALALRLRENGDIQGFLDIAKALAEKPEVAIGLNAKDLWLAGALTACIDAVDLADTFINGLGEDSVHHGFLKGAQALTTSRDEAFSLFEAWCKDDPESYFDVAQYLCERDDREGTHDWIERTRQAANRTQRRTVLVDIALLEESLKDK